MKQFISSRRHFVPANNVKFVRSRFAYRFQRVREA